MLIIKLENKDGTLYYPPSVVPEFGELGLIVLRIHDAGNCDTIKWPMRKKDRENLPAALFDDRESGLIPDNAYVVTPDNVGVEF